MVSTSEFELIGACVYVCVRVSTTCLYMSVAACVDVFNTKSADSNSVAIQKWQQKWQDSCICDRTRSWAARLTHMWHDLFTWDMTRLTAVRQQTSIYTFLSLLVSIYKHIYLYLYINTSRHTCTAQCMSASAARANQYVYISISTICTDLNICIFSELYIRFSKFTQPLYCDMQRIRMCDTTQ